MKYVCQVTNESKQAVLSIRTTSSVENLPQILGACFSQIMGYMQQEGVEMSGAPFTAYYNMDMNNLDIEVGVPIGSEVKGEGTIKCNYIPSGKYISTLHIGSYSQIEPAYNALGKYMEEHNFVATGVAYEFYLNDPVEIPEERLETRIAFLLK